MASDFSTVQDPEKIVAFIPQLLNFTTPADFLKGFVQFAASLRIGRSSLFVIQFR
jgi:hypothetical protein